MDPYDENAIKAYDTVIRKINPKQHVVPDKNNQCDRISTKAFSMSSGVNAGMSVEIESLILDDELDPITHIVTPDFTGAVSFRAIAIRSCELIVGYDPVDGNPYHGEVWCCGDRTKFTASQKKSLLREANWYVEIPGVELIT